MHRLLRGNFNPPPQSTTPNDYANDYAYDYANDYANQRAVFHVRRFMSDDQRASRREFLKGPLPGRNSNVAAEVSGDSKSRDPAASQQRQASYLECYANNAMACEFEIYFNMQQYPQSGAAAGEAFQMIDAIEDQLTVYRDHSEVSQINRSAADGSITVEENLFHVFETARKIFEGTGGAFDITAAKLTKLWQFDRRSGALPPQPQIDRALETVGMNFVELDPGELTIQFKKAGVEINLGGIGKGHALDRVANRFLELGIDDFVIHGGQSSVLAHGNSTTVDRSPDDLVTEGWHVGLSHPTLPDKRLAEICLRGKALGTSGTGRQGFFHAGKRYGHIIDPRTGWPSSHILSSTVIAETAAEADALATAFFVMSIEDVSDYCDAHADIGSVLVVPDSKGHATVRVFGLADDCITILVP